MFIALALVAVLAAGAPPTSIPNPADQDLKPGERRVKIKCKVENLNGSRIAKRRCMTLEEWKRQEDEANRALDDARGRSPMAPTCHQQGRPC